MRKNIVAGNWKMNLDKSESILLVKDILKRLTNNQTEIILAPSYIHLNEISDLVKNKNIMMAAQDCSANKEGAYTGEVSASMIASYNMDYVILGHSERRSNFNESNDILISKLQHALENNLKVIFCCGEGIEHRNRGVHFGLIEEQLASTLFHLSSDDFSSIVIAYEPIWAIGTGITASVEQAQEMHAFIRGLLKRNYGSNISESTSLLYGGSCNAGNAKELFACKDVDGGLIGGASLNSKDFIKVINCF